MGIVTQQYCVGRGGRVLVSDGVCMCGFGKTVHLCCRLCVTVKFEALVLTDSTGLEGENACGSQERSVVSLPISILQ